MGPFTQAWVLVHHDAAAFSEHRMREFLTVMMAPHVSACEDAFPGIASSLSNFLSLLHDFTIVGRTAAGRILDLHRNFIIKNTSEHALYIDFLGGRQLGGLGGARLLRPPGAGGLRGRRGISRQEAETALRTPELDADSVDDVAPLMEPIRDDVPRAEEFWLQCADRRCGARHMVGQATHAAFSEDTGARFTCAVVEANCRRIRRRAA